MSNFNKKTAVILFNLGGPDSLEAVQPFLFNLFNDAAIIQIPQPFRFLLAKLISSRRAKKAQKIYSILGGKSPLLDTTLAQAYSLERELSFVGNFKVFTVMRYYHPFAKEVVKKVQEYDPSEIILLPLYPQFSSATSDSSIKDFTRFLYKFPKKPKVKTVCCYPFESDFIKAHSFLIKQTLIKYYETQLSEFRFLFSAHGLPQKLIDAGDPYVLQVTKTTAEVVKNLAEILCINEAEIDFKVCYQSKVGPLQWTQPSLDFALRKAILDNKIPVIIPISFVSDHVETLVELDVEYKELAMSLGAKNYLRVPALNLDGHFIKALFEICKTVSVNSEDNYFSGTEPVRFCTKKFKFCSNPNPCTA
jgi:ferrochelatase